MLSIFYGKDTRSVRVLNLVIHVLWTYLIITDLGGFAKVDLPEKTEPSFAVILGLSVATVIATSFSFVQSKLKVRLKYISLTLGSFTQTLIGLKYATNYPPFDVMVIVCTILAVWFVCGAIFIKNSQGNINVVGES